MKLESSKRTQSFILFLWSRERKKERKREREREGGGGRGGERQRQADRQTNRQTQTEIGLDGPQSTNSKPLELLYDAAMMHVMRKKLISYVHRKTGIVEKRFALSGASSVSGRLKKPLRGRHVSPSQGLLQSQGDWRSPWEGEKFRPLRGFFSLGETEEAPERADRFSTIPFPSLSGCVAYDDEAYQNVMPSLKSILKCDVNLWKAY